ncbi:mucin-5AC-like isoform X22 [Haliotis rufescens]|uniref:mucin-5AC-like isoform X22 n=1 Tax=Haliotis rufescens TaxID=6454 RepID=UPI00201F3933|nr:mucin-5AC-like isoform X22 [Haliotis rufescens]
MFPTMASRWTLVFLVVHFASLFLTAIGETCSYSDQVGKKGPQNLWRGFKATATLDACKTFCGTQSVCKAGEFNSGSFSCYLYSSEPTLTADTQTTFFLRTCVAETTTAAATVTPTTSHPTTVATSTSTETTTAATTVITTTSHPTTVATSTSTETTTAATTVITTTSHPTTVATSTSTATTTATTIASSTTPTPTLTTSTFPETTTSTTTVTTTSHPTTVVTSTSTETTTAATTVITTTSHPTTVATSTSTATTTATTIASSTTPTPTLTTSTFPETTTSTTTVTTTSHPTTVVTSTSTETTTAATTVITTTSHPMTVATSSSTATTTAATFVTSTTPTPTTLTTSTFPDTTTTSAPTTSPTTTPTTNPKSCLMTKSSRTTDGAVDYKVSLGNADSCNSICLHTKTCRATTYTPGNCTLHSQTLTAASGDIVDFVRQTCNDGTFCCMSSATTQKTNGTPLLSISTTASLEGCEAICLAVADCKATYYSDESCFFYTTTPTTTSDGPILFSKKTCPGDQTNHGQLAYDTTCEERPKKTYRQTHMYTSFHHNYNVYDMWGPQQLRIYWYYPWPYYSVPDYAYFFDTVLMLALLAD